MSDAKQIIYVETPEGRSLVNIIGKLRAEIADLEAENADLRADLADMTPKPDWDNAPTAQLMVDKMKARSRELVSAGRSPLHALAQSFCELIVELGLEA